MSPELTAKIEHWRMLAATRKLTEAEMAQAVAEIRQGRMSAAIASQTARTKKAKAATPPPDANSLLDGMMGD